MDKNKFDGFLKTYTSKSGEFLTKITIKNLPVYFFTDKVGTSSVGLEMNNRLEGSDILNSSMYYGFNNYSYLSDDKKEYRLESKKMDTKETILGIPCSHYLLNFKQKDSDERKESFKVCIDDQSSYNNVPVLSGLINFFDKNTKIKSSGLKGLILKGGPEKTYDTEYFVASSMKDSKDFVYFDHLKTMMKQQRKQDSIMLAHQKEEEDMVTDTVAYADSSFVEIDSTTALASPTHYVQVDSYIPNYVSEYKKAQSDASDLAINNTINKNLLKGIPKHCKNFEAEIPSFSHKDLKGHLKNYVGQMCDMYLTQSDNHSVGIKITLDEIRREVLYLNEIQEKLDQSDKKKLNNYLKNLD